MKIGIDIRALGGRQTGIGRYLNKLLEALAKVDRQNRYVLFYNALKGNRPELGSCGFPVISSRWPNKVLTQLWSRTRYPSVESLIGPVDVFHSPNFQMPPVAKGASVLTVHDLVFLVNPELASPDAVKDYGPWIGRYLERADLVVADSVATTNDIVKHLNIAPEKVISVYPGATVIPRATADEKTAIYRRYAIDGDYILFVGCIEPRKNLARLFQAFELSGLARDFKLILVGPNGWRTGAIFETWRSLSCRDRIQWLDFVTDDTLAALYSGARFLAFPSLMEGFGLPILEAMSVGCPVLTSNVSSMPEVGGEAALYIDPYEIDSIAEGLKKLACDTELRAKLSKAGYEQAKLFTWEKTAEGMISVYEKAAELRGMKDNHENRR